MSDADPINIWNRITSSLDDLVVIVEPASGTLLLECLRCGVITDIDPYAVSINNLLILVADHKCRGEHRRTP